MTPPHKGDEMMNEEPDFVAGPSLHLNCRLSKEDNDRVYRFITECLELSKEKDKQIAELNSRLSKAVEALNLISHNEGGPTFSGKTALDALTQIKGDA